MKREFMVSVPSRGIIKINSIRCNHVNTWLKIKFAGENEKR